ncbi:MAG: ABC transporter ATP-binding protein [Phycisphaerae bacterium]
MSDPDRILRLTDVTKQYPGPAGGGEGPTVLRGVNLTVSAGETLSILGPSGSGKSTLLNILGALDRPTAGQVLLEGEDLSDLGERQLARVRNRRIGFVFQMHHLLPQCTLLENVLVPTLAGADIDRDAAEKRARELLDRVGLGDRLAHRPGELSGGECQRVAVVRALVNDPALLLADEPTGSLDRRAADNLAELLLELNRDRGVTLICVTHALSLAQRMGTVHRLRDGQLSEDTDGAESE